MKNNKIWVKKLIIFTVGMLTMAFGIALSIRAGLGVAPGGTISYAMFNLTPLSVGHSVAIFHIFCVLIQLALTRKMTVKLALQIPFAYVFGAILDLFYSLMIFSLPNFVVQMLLLIVGLLIFSFGIRAIVGSNILLMPPDGLAIAIGKMFNWTVGKAKLIFDIVVTVVTMLLTFFIAENAFLVVGVGTVICAIGTGPAIGFYVKMFPALDVDKVSKK